MNLDTDIIPFVEINLNWIIDLNIKCKTKKLLEDNIGESLDDLGYANDFLNTTLQTQSMKEIINSLDFIKIKNLCSAKDDIKRMRRQAKNWEKIFAKDASDEGLLFQINKELLKFNNKKINNLSQKWANCQNIYLTNKVCLQKDVQHHMLFGNRK